MKVSSHLLKKLSDMLANTPLETGECRRVEGMGAHFISLEKVQDTHKRFLLSVKINGQEYFLFKEVEV